MKRSCLLFFLPILLLLSGCCITSRVVVEREISPHHIYGYYGVWDGFWIELEPDTNFKDSSAPPDYQFIFAKPDTIKVESNYYLLERGRKSCIVFTDDNNRVQIVKTRDKKRIESIIMSLGG